ncbi:unnamed protein product [Pylaiella littoralis]
MGSFSSKGGAVLGRGARSVAKNVANGKPIPSTGSHLPVKDDLLTNFKPTKGKFLSQLTIVEMSRSDAQAAAKRMYDHEVPDMNPDILRQAMALGPVGKAELTHQASIYLDQFYTETSKLVPDASEEVKPKTPRPLPKDRTRAVARSSEVDAKKGLLTQTQLAAFLERGVAGGSSAPSPPGLLEEFHVSEDDAAVLLRYYRAPDIRMYEDVMTARWHWPTGRDHS